MKRTTTISRLVEICLRFLGVWPDSPYATLYWVIYMLSIIVVQYFQYAYVSSHFDLSNIPVLMDCLSLTLAYTLAFLKFFVLWWNRKVFYQVLTAMKEDWKESVASESYISIMTNVADVASRYANIMITVNGFTAFFLTVGEYLSQYMNNAKEEGEHPRELPIKMEFPFDITGTPIFELILVGQFVYEFILASLVGMMNALLVTMILHVCGQIDILLEKIQDVSRNCSDSIISSALIKDVIRKHQKIIIMAENIETIYCYIALMQILWNTLVICCTGFVIIITIGTDVGVTALFKSVSFYIAITFEAFILCFSGEYLGAKTKSVGDAIYEATWYEMSISNSRILLYVIARCQKRVTITAGKFLELSLEGFTAIMKASASYVSVLHAMY